MINSTKSTLNTVQISWDDLTKGFCESRYSSPPEYVNSFSSLLIVLIATYGIYGTKQSSLIVKLIYGTMFITGIGSFGFHWTLHYGWSLMDRVPMIIGVILGSYMYLDLIIWTTFVGRLKLIRSDNNQSHHKGKNDPESQLPLPGTKIFPNDDQISEESEKYDKDLSKGKKKYHYVSSTIAIIYCTYMVTVISLTGAYPDNELLFSLLFTFPLLILLSCIFASRFSVHKYLTDRSNINYRENMENFKIMWIGVISGVISGVIWSMTENLCKEYEWLKYTQGHLVWHLGIAYCFHLITQSMVYIRAPYESKIPSIKNYRNKKWYTNILPLIEYIQ